MLVFQGARGLNEDHQTKPSSMCRYEKSYLDGMGLDLFQSAACESVWL